MKPVIEHMERTVRMQGQDRLGGGWAGGGRPRGSSLLLGHLLPSRHATALLCWPCFLSFLHAPAHVSSISPSVRCERTGIWSPASTCCIPGRGHMPGWGWGLPPAGEAASQLQLSSAGLPSPACQPHRQVRPPFQLPVLCARAWPLALSYCRALS